VDDPEKKIIDLHPREWRADIPNKREPFFGSGAQEWLWYLIGLTITLTAVHLFFRG
jgi:hypothetical protein